MPPTNPYQRGPRRSPTTGAPRSHRGAGPRSGDGINVTQYVKQDGTRVREHTRSHNARRVVAAWSSTATSGAVTLALVLEAGLTLISALAMLITFLAGWAAASISAKTTQNHKTVLKQRRKRAKARAKHRTKTTRARQKRRR